MRKKESDKAESETGLQSEAEAAVAAEPPKVEETPPVVEVCMYCGEPVSRHAPYCVVLRQTTKDCEAKLVCRACQCRIACTVKESGVV
jgi:hypothetical protein